MKAFWYQIVSLFTNDLIILLYVKQNGRNHNVTRNKIANLFSSLLIFVCLFIRSYICKFVYLLPALFCMYLHLVGMILIVCSFLSDLGFPLSYQALILFSLSISVVFMQHLPSWWLSSSYQRYGILPGSHRVQPQSKRNGVSGAACHSCCVFLSFFACQYAL